MSFWQYIETYGPGDERINNDFKKDRAKKRKKLRKNKIKLAKKFREEQIRFSTKAELKMKEVLKNLKIKHEFQKVFNTKKYDDISFRIADFYLPDYGTIIEVDGGYHDNLEQQQLDQQRSKELKAKNKVCKIVRFKNEEVLGNPDFHLALILKLFPSVKPYLKVKLPFALYGINSRTGAELTQAAQDIRR